MQITQFYQFPAFTIQELLNQCENVQKMLCRQRYVM